MDQSGGVGELDSHRGRAQAAQIVRPQAAAEKHQGRAEALAAGREESGHPFAGKGMVALDRHS
jgi:hypothetical protein